MGHIIDKTVYGYERNLF